MLSGVGPFSSADAGLVVGIFTGPVEGVNDELTVLPPELLVPRTSRVPPLLDGCCVITADPF